MLSEFTIRHHSKKSAVSHDHGLGSHELENAEFGSDVFQFKTCLREIAIGWNLPAGPGVMTGSEAYQFLLEVICGLHSPIIGETEVMGQFKTAGLEFAKNNSSLSRIIKNLLEDAKLVRQKHLVDIGSQSYGSFARKLLRGSKKVRLIGAGQLSQEIVTWLVKESDREIEVVTRSPERYQQVFAKQFPNVKLISFGAVVDAFPGQAQEQSFDSAVICAPFSTQELLPLCGGVNTSGLIVDLRGEVPKDELAQGLAPISSVTVVDLPQIFLEISSNQIRSQAKKNAAENEIEALATKRSQAMEIRPFGWEDVCA